MSKNKNVDRLTSQRDDFVDLTLIVIFLFENI